MRRHDGSLKLHLRGNQDDIDADCATLQANGLTGSVCNLPNCSAPFENSKLPDPLSSASLNAASRQLPNWREHASSLLPCSCCAETHASLLRQSGSQSLV